MSTVFLAHRGQRELKVRKPKSFFFCFPQWLLLLEWIIVEWLCQDRPSSARSSLTVIKCAVYTMKTKQEPNTLVSCGVFRNAHTMECNLRPAKHFSSWVLVWEAWHERVNQPLPKIIEIASRLVLLAAYFIVSLLLIVLVCIIQLLQKKINKKHQCWNTWNIFGLDPGCFSTDEK